MIQCHRKSASYQMNDSTRLYAITGYNRRMCDYCEFLLRRQCWFWSIFLKSFKSRRLDTNWWFISPTCITVTHICSRFDLTTNTMLAWRIFFDFFELVRALSAYIGFDVISLLYESLRRKLRLTVYRRSQVTVVGIWARVQSGEKLSFRTCNSN